VPSEAPLAPRHLRRCCSPLLRQHPHSTEMCSGSEAGSYLRIIDSCITQLKAQGPSWTCNESKEVEEEQRAQLKERHGIYDEVVLFLPSQPFEKWPT